MQKYNRPWLIAALTCISLLAAACNQNPTAKCRDGSNSYSQHRQGTCSGHRGVAQWLN